MTEYIKRIGQVVNQATSPAYRLLWELETAYVAEYCNVWRILPKEMYERVQP